MYSLRKVKEISSTWKPLAVGLVIVAAIQIAMFKPQTVFATSYKENAKQISPIEVTPVTPTKPKFLQIIRTNDNVNYTQQDLFCMAKNIYHEAGSEPLLGKYAVAQVTINRIKSPQYADTVCSVVFEPNQFSWASQHSRRWSTPKGRGWVEANRIAHDVLENNKRVHGLGNALFFHATHVRPQWASRKNELARIGLHIFYEPRRKNRRA
jgi:spore germination cell wall hydrolase CwlJ-like protein